MGMNEITAECTRAYMDSWSKEATEIDLLKSISEKDDIPTGNLAVCTRTRKPLVGNTISLRHFGGPSGERTHVISKHSAPSPLQIPLILLMVAKH